MRIIAHLTIDGVKEIAIEGNAQIFDRRLKPWLGDIGFWLTDWRYCEPDATNHKKSKVFVPWSSCLMVEELS